LGGDQTLRSLLSNDDECQALTVKGPTYPLGGVVDVAGGHDRGLEELIGLGEALAAKSESGDLVTSGSKLVYPWEGRSVRFQLRMKIKSHGLAAGRIGKGVAVGARVSACFNRWGNCSLLSLDWP
jgi:hypothetical protein